MAAAGRALRALAVLTASAAAFDTDAHDAIGQTAASAMDQEAIKGMKRLLGGQDASDVAGWGHQVDDTFPGMTRLHFDVHDDVAQPFCGPVAERVGQCENGICLSTAIKHFYGKVLQDEGRKIEFPEININKAEKFVSFTDADRVKMLINLIGDLHQPMHVGYAGDDNGRKKMVNFRGQQMSLYDVWDKGISENVRTQESNFWLGGWTHVRAIQAEFEKDKELWKKEGAFKAFEKWAAESVEFACSKAYTHPATGKRLVGPGSDPGVPTIDDGAYEMWREAWLRQILLAGERTAIVLNDILDAKGAKNLGDGSNIKTKADEEKDKEQVEINAERIKINKEEKARRGYTTPFHINGPVALTNFGIACVTVPIFLMVANYGLNPANWLALANALLNSNAADAAAAAGSGSGGASRPAQKRFE